MKKMKKWAVLATIISMLLLAACGNSSTNTSGVGESSTTAENGSGSGETIKIGLLNPMTGDAAAWGQYSREAAQLVVDEINEQGGILGGRKVELIVEDSKASAEGTTLAMNKFINQDKVAAIVGNSYSTAALAGRDITAKAGMLYIVTGAKHPEITDKGHPYLFRVNTTQDQDGVGFIKLITEDIQAKRLAIIAEQTDYGYFFKDMLETKLLEKGVEIVASEVVPFSTSDFSTQITKFKSQNPDAVAIVLGSQPTTAAFLKQMKEFNLEAERIIMGGNLDGNLVNLAGEAIEGILTVDIYVQGLQNEENKKLVEGLKARGVENVSKIHLQSYDAMRVLLTAMDGAGSTDPEQVAEYIRTHSFTSPRGSELQFDEKGQVQADLVTITVRNGEIVPR